MPKRNEEREALWRGRVVDQRESGLSVRQYCLREKLSEASFYSWRRELALRDREDKETIEVGKSGEGLQSFVPVHVASALPAHASLELLHRSGHVIRISAGFDDESLRRLLSVLEG